MPSGTLFHRLGHSGADVFELIGLDDVVCRANGQAVDGDLDVGHGSDHHDRGVGEAVANVPQQLEAVHLRHAQIAQHERDRIFLQLLERLEPISCLDALKTVASHQVHHHLAEPRLIVDDQTVRQQF